MSNTPRRHVVIPDTQIRPDTPLNHLVWIGEYLAEKKPDVIVQIGDWYDMASLSSYEKKGGTYFEGKRYKDDIAAGNLGWELLTKPMTKEIWRLRKNKKRQWCPEMHYTLGNHESRIERAVKDNAVLEGVIGYDDFAHTGWERHGFLEPVWVDGICYSHYFANPNSGRPYTGMMETRLKNIAHSFVMGHQQVLSIGRRETLAGAHHGLVVGNCYLHSEEYRGPQSNNEWRGICILNEVTNGAYDLCLVSLDYLCRKYEGMTREEFMVRPELHTTFK